jgi:predicted amidophosphoribosyltransferase
LTTTGSVEVHFINEDKIMLENYCTNCGNKRKENDKYCSNCGKEYQVVKKENEGGDVNNKNNKIILLD